LKSNTRPLLRQADAIQRNHVGVTFRSDRVVEIAVGSLVRIDMLVTIGSGQPRTFLSNQESRAIACACDIEPHHIGEIVRDAVRLEVGDDGQGVLLARRAQPRVQENPLLDRFDDRGIGVAKFHRASRIR
jgi:hypothetical protein